MRGSFRNNFNGSLSISYLLKNLRFTNTVSLGLNNSENSPYGTFSDYVRMNPYWYPWDEEGNLIPTFNTFPNSGGSTVANPLYDASLPSFDKTKYTNIRNQLRVEWDIFKGMKIGGGFGYTKQTDRGDRFQPRSHSGFLQVSDEDSKGSYDWKYGEMRLQPVTEILLDDIAFMPGRIGICKRIRIVNTRFCYKGSRMIT